MAFQSTESTALYGDFIPFPTRDRKKFGLPTESLSRSSHYPHSRDYGKISGGMITILSIDLPRYTYNLLGGEYLMGADSLYSNALVAPHISLKARAAPCELLWTSLSSQPLLNTFHSHISLPFGALSKRRGPVLDTALLQNASVSALCLLPYFFRGGRKASPSPYSLVETTIWAKHLSVLCPQGAVHRWSVSRCCRFGTSNNGDYRIRPFSHQPCCKVWHSRAGPDENQYFYAPGICVRLSEILAGSSFKYTLMISLLLYCTSATA